MIEDDPDNEKLNNYHVVSEEQEAADNENFQYFVLFSGVIYFLLLCIPIYYFTH